MYEETKEALENFKKRKLNKEESLEDKIKDYIEENIKTADINELAQKLGYTTVYTGVLVKKITGYSFTDFVSLSSKADAFPTKLQAHIKRIDRVLTSDLSYYYEALH